MAYVSLHECSILHQLLWLYEPTLVLLLLLLLPLLLPLLLRLQLGDVNANAIVVVNAVNANANAVARAVEAAACWILWLLMWYCLSIASARCCTSATGGNLVGGCGRKTWSSHNDTFAMLSAIILGSRFISCTLLPNYTSFYLNQTHQ
jgi:hypothetical protein